MIWQVLDVVRLPSSRLLCQRKRNRAWKAPFAPVLWGKRGGRAMLLATVKRDFSTRDSLEMMQLRLADDWRSAAADDCDIDDNGVGGCCCCYFLWSKRLVVVLAWPRGSVLPSTPSSFVARFFYSFFFPLRVGTWQWDGSIPWQRLVEGDGVQRILGGCGHYEGFRD